MQWQRVTCDERSNVESISEPTARAQYAQLMEAGADPQCVMAATGKFTVPIDAARLRRDAQAAIRKARTEGAGVHFCSGRHLARSPHHGTTWVGVKSGGENASKLRSYPEDLVRDTPTEAFRNASLAQFPDALEEWRLAHPDCVLPDVNDPYEILVLLTAAALDAERRAEPTLGRRQSFPSIAFVGDSIHRNMMATLIAMLRGQRKVVLDRQTHHPTRYVLTTHGDSWTVDRSSRSKKKKKPALTDAPTTTPTPASQPRAEETLLEIFFGSTFQQPSGVPIMPVPLATRAETRNFTAIVTGGLLHGEGSCLARPEPLKALHQCATMFHKWAAANAGTLRAQTLIFRDPTRVVRQRADHAKKNLPRGGLASFDDAKGHVWRAIATAMQRAFGRSSGSAVFTLQSLERNDAMRDVSTVGLHPDLLPLDHVHKACVARWAYPKPVNAFTPFTRSDACRAWYERAMLSIAIAQIFSRVRD